MRRILRVGLLVASLAGVVATVAPTPAQATTEGSLTVTGTASVSNHGIAYPLIDSDGPLVGDPLDLSKTPDHFSNSASVHFVGSGVGAATTTKKATPVEAGDAAIVGDGRVHGYCGLSEGTLHGTASVLLVTGGSQHYSFSLSWTAAAGDLIITGHIQKHGTSHSGVLEGVVNATPTTGSCLNKLEKHFTVTGAITFTLLSTPTSLPHVTIPKTSVHPPHASIDVSTPMGTHVTQHASLPGT